MWTPTHVQVTVQRAKGLLYKGKNGTNDVFVTIALGKEKYQTSVKERATDPVTWFEECELPIPKQGNKAEIVLTALHRNFIGDEFLGMVNIPLSEFDVYDKPKNKWYVLKSKPGKEKSKNRGELEVRVGFTVVANAGPELTKKSHKSSLGQLASSVGGSLLSLGKEKKTGLKTLVKSVGNKVSTLPGRGKKKEKGDSFGTISEQQDYLSPFKKQTKVDADPGVISDDEDEFRFDELSHKSSHSSLAVSQRGESLENLGGGEFLRRNVATPPPPQMRTPIREEQSEAWNADPTDSIDDWEAKLFGKTNSAKGKASTLEVPGRGSPTISKLASPGLSGQSSFNTHQSLKKDEPGQPQEIIFDVVKTEKSFSENEPIPKPRQLSQIIKSESKAKSVSLENISAETKAEEKPKKEKHKHISKDSFTSLFGSRTKLNVDESKSSSASTPVGITNPIRVKGNVPTQQETRLPKETFRKFEGKSREDLIETIVALQSQVKAQEKKMSDLEDYIDNLLVRVMENKPTLLQNSLNGSDDQGKSSVMRTLYGKGSRSTARTID